MSDLHVEATPATRGASTAPSGRLTARERTDLTATFDQIFAAVAQAAPRVTPQPAPLASVHAELPEPLEPVASPVVADEPYGEEAAVVEDSPSPAAAPPYAASPTPLKSLERQDRAAEEPRRDRVEPTAPLRPAARDRHAVEHSPAPSHAHPERVVPSASEAPRKPAAQSKGKESLATSTEQETADRKSDTKARASRAESGTKREAPVATQPTSVAPESSAPKAHAETAAAAVAFIAPHEAATVAPVSSVATNPIETPARHGAPRDGHQGRPAKQPASRLDAPPSAVTKPDTPARPASDAPAATSQTEVAAKPAADVNAVDTAKYVEQLSKSDSRVKTAAIAAEKSAPSRGERVEPVPAMPGEKSHAVADTKPTLAPQQAASQQDAKPAATPNQARTAETSIAAGALPDAPTSERRRARESRPTLTTNVEVKPAASSTPGVTRSADAAVPSTLAQAPPAVVNQVAAPSVATPSVAAPTVSPTVEPSSVKSETPPPERGRTSIAPNAPAAESHDRPRVATEETKSTTAKRVASDPQHEVDRVRLIQRVAKALQTAQDRGGTLRIRLTPPELGALKIELIVRDGALSARLEAETPAAKTAILESLPALRERLTAQEIKIERFDVDLMQQSDHSGGERHSFADAESSREQADLRRAWRNESSFAKPAAAAQTAPAAPERNSNGGLNVLA